MLETFLLDNAGTAGMLAVGVYFLNWRVAGLHKQINNGLSSDIKDIVKSISEVKIDVATMKGACLVCPGRKETSI